jgi:hypothetical protein
MTLPVYARRGWAILPRPAGVAVFRDGRRVCATDDLGALLRALGPAAPDTERVAALAAHCLGAVPPAPAPARPVAYVCSPYAPRPGETVAQHTLWAQAVARLAYDEGFWPVAPHLYAPQWLDDADPAERADGLRWGLAQLRGAAVVYVFTPDGRPSPGMAAELDQAAADGLPLRLVTYAEVAASAGRLPAWATLTLKGA